MKVGWKHLAIKSSKFYVSSISSRLECVHTPSPRLLDKVPTPPPQNCRSWCETESRPTGGRSRSRFDARERCRGRFQKIDERLTKYDWLVGGDWNMNSIFQVYWAFHHPNWLSYFSEGLKPPTSTGIWLDGINTIEYYGLWIEYEGDFQNFAQLRNI